MSVRIITATDADRISQEILSRNEDEVMAISIMDIFGNILSSKSREFFKNKFRLIRDDYEEEDSLEYGAALSASILALSNERKGIFREAQAIITVYKDCKIMLLPLPSYHILIELVFQHSVNVEDFNTVDKIERILLR